MKKIYAFFALAILTLSLNAQILPKSSVKTIVQQRNIYLNGGLNAELGGTSRSLIRVDLPRNTKGWYYSFSTSPGESGIKNLRLALQLSAKMADPTGIGESIVNEINVPSGSGAIDVYLLDQPNSDLFLKKVDNDGGSFFYKREGTISATKQAVVDIKEIRNGTFYLALKNPSTLDGINVFIEVVAIVEEKQELTEEQTQAVSFADLGWMAYQRGGYAKCIDLSQKALALDNTMGYIRFNIALSLLSGGKSDEATMEYVKAIAATKKMSNYKDIFKAAIDDLEKYKDKITAKIELGDILGLLKNEL